MAVRKGQFSLEYYISLLIFIGFVIYLLFQVQILIPNHLREIRVQTLRLEAYQVSELIANDGGQPNNWNEPAVADSDIKRIGLSALTEQNVLSTAKVAALDTKCRNLGYASLRDWLDMQNQFYIIVQDTDNTLVNTQERCPPTARIGSSTTVVVTRVVTFDSGKSGTLTLTVW